MGMFYDCRIFNQCINTWIPISGTEFSSMFNGCVALNQSFDGWNVSSGQSFNGMFTDCTALNQPFVGWVFTRALHVPNADNTIFSAMFRGCSNMTGTIGFYAPFLEDVYDLGQHFHMNVMYIEDHQETQLRVVNTYVRRQYLNAYQPMRDILPEDLSTQVASYLFPSDQADEFQHDLAQFVQTRRHHTHANRLIPSSTRVTKKRKLPVAEEW
jgi:hypothetical protein